MAEVNTCDLDLKTLIYELENEFSKEHTPSDIVEPIRALLERYNSELNEWKRYAFFDPIRYTRNLIAKGTKFSLLLLCWPKSTSSPVHDHTQSDCWLRVIKNNVRETVYHYVADDLPLVKTTDSIYPEGTVGYIHDRLALHAVSNPGADVECVTLHLYSPTFGKCNVYLTPDVNGLHIERQFCDFSEYGVKTMPNCKN